MSFFTCIEVQDGKYKNCFHIYSDSIEDAKKSVNKLGEGSENIAVLSIEDGNKLYKKLRDIYETIY